MTYPIFTFFSASKQRHRTTSAAKRSFFRQFFFSFCVLYLTLGFSPVFAQGEKSIARVWNEQLLWGIRLDTARPTVHARNLYHFSVAMWDAWAAFDPDATAVIHHEKISSEDIDRGRKEAMSYAAYRLIMWRFRHSPNHIQTESSANRKMIELGYDHHFEDETANTPAGLGLRIAGSIIQHGLSDGSNEQHDYVNQHYQPLNKSLDPSEPGNPDMLDPNRWQPLHIPKFVGQSGELAENYPPFIGPEWGNVIPFSLTTEDSEVRYRDGNRYRIYLNPGPPPMLGANQPSAERYKAGFEQVIQNSSELDPKDRVIIDISPGARGNNSFATNDGNGHKKNPASGKPYAPQLVYAGDYYRVLAEFWADGPNSETPPGHWFLMLNYVIDNLNGNKHFRGDGPLMDDLQWDVQAYLALGGAMHDVAIAAWSNKGWYDYTRPVSAIRYLCDRGQSSDANLPNYHPQGINLIPGLIELITGPSLATGQRHAHLNAQTPKNRQSNLHQIAIRSWRGPSYVQNTKEDTSGVGWILCKNWWPYQRPNFVTPPFAGYVSGHSTYSRAAAEVLTLVTGSRYFPGGYAFFRIPRDKYLHFEKGPSESFQLQWATYQDAADECSISRIYGGIHPIADDIPGRIMGYKIGHKAFNKAMTYFPKIRL
ncbi:MAG: hypothetical protein GKR96_14270 [Gammaproteobacteria bacterium]|nr:hypothetical protein [Gammaproteobacteria bacterium]